MGLFLVVTDGRSSPQVLRLEDSSRLRIGRRHDCDIPLQERSVSRQHCILDVRQGRLFVTDTLSRNGVWLDGARLTSPGEARPGAIIRLGGVRIEVVDNPGIAPEDLRCSRALRRILNYLPAQGSSRKLRLTACAWYRHVIGVSPNERLHRLVDLAEQHADGIVSATELAREREAGEIVFSNCTHSGGHAMGPLCLAAADSRLAAESLLDSLSGFRDSNEVVKLMAALAHDVLGDFFHPFHPAGEWLEWNEGTLVNMARTIYAARDFTAMPVLGDALEDAGCCDEEVLRHCRGETLHTRGCWVLDSLLGTPRPRTLDPGPEVTMAPH